MDRIHLPRKPRRFVILHYHIMKNAGSTVAGILEREFPKHFQEMDGDHFDGDITPGELLRYIRDHEAIQALTSHQIRLPLFESDEIVPFGCCFVRHPIDRIFSLYRYSRDRDTATPLGAIARRYSLGGFARELLNSLPHLVCNPQTSLIANAGRFTRPPDEDDLARAIQIMRKLAIPGVVHRFDESMVSAEYYMQPAFPGLQLHHAPKNVSRALATPLSEREAEFRAATGEEIFRQISVATALDFELFRAAEAEVQRRISMVPNMDARLEEFRRRCGSLQYKTAAA